MAISNKKLQKIMTLPINQIFRYLQNRSRVQVWLHEQCDPRPPVSLFLITRVEGAVWWSRLCTSLHLKQNPINFDMRSDLRIEGRILGFDEYMNLVIDDAEEIMVKKKTRRAIGRILLKGDNICLMMNTGASDWSKGPSMQLDGSMRGRAGALTCLAAGLRLALTEDSERYSNIPACAISGQRYIQDDSLDSAAPNGGVNIRDSTACQTLCAEAGSQDCSVFTYYISNGGCWLHGEGLQTEPFPGVISGLRSCPERPVTTTTLEYAGPAEADRFIQVDGALYFETVNPPSKHLLRAGCPGCPASCADFVKVPPAYSAKLAWTEDFSCEMVSTTTTNSLPVVWADSKSASPWGAVWSARRQDGNSTSVWGWVVAIALLGCGAAVGSVYWDQQRRKKLRHKLARTGFIPPGFPMVENQPLMRAQPQTYAPMAQEYDVVTVTPQGLQISPAGAGGVAGSYPTPPGRNFGV
ncbi:unnamed protein product [Polarella glacialis]|uniref:Sm protein E n=1 Tax=Polarella glacialis TaxID=89957 RepID=A0A813G589_POLGL|nr:unnamed protein product [Polarella glacialis]